MENKYAADIAEKEDEQLLQLLQESNQLDDEAILAVLEEIEKRNLHVPGLEQLKKDIAESIETQQRLHEAETTVEAEQRTATDKAKDFLKLFVPRPYYFVTPILADLNILIFIAMVIIGVGIMEPEIQDLLNWGANFGPYTLTGEAWRLFSCMFLHIGLLHLLLNMLALVNIGSMLEPLIGKKQFAIAYILCGLSGSVASLWWDPTRVSAGASGAIFGMFGMFLMVMLLERQLPWTNKKAMLLNVGGVIGLNLMFGLKSGIDNAAHIGGLICGLLLGAVLLLRSGRHVAQTYSSFGNIATVIAGVVVLSAMFLSIPKDKVQFVKVMQSFAGNEAKAMEVFRELVQDSTAATASKFNEPLQQSIALWDESIADLAALQSLEGKEAKQVELMLDYARLRKKSYEMVREDLLENRSWLHPKQQQVLYAISTYLQEIEELSNEDLTEPAPTQSTD
ncbi:rhomboid family intramembrane serine protease [Pontibacter silvestris]|uniref:Rhomboid family intramembrane serine protease n=1 Tax=Pontibacter silvestris TaxID=2305183 RepID=A0ABW4WWP5_9BACT|nr:rhomboid family intramembrane serine protease [Pontibacter silvestris]MCC9138514.1 rhomboid family intramembrane serine protease [Pontibacter silvestris]